MTLFGVTPPTFPKKQKLVPPPFELPERLRSEVVFGTPSKNCIGNGICILTQYRAKHPLVCGCPKALAWFSVDVASRQIQLEFEWAGLSSEVQQRYFSGNLFLMEESVKVPLIFAKKWKIGTTLYLKSGYHLLIRYQEKIVVVFKY